MEHVYKLKLVEYETYGNNKDGWEVDRVDTLIDDLVRVSDKELSLKEIVKSFHNQKIFNIFGSTLCKIDYREIYLVDLYPFIEMYQRKDDKPVGRVEVIE